MNVLHQHEHEGEHAAACALGAGNNLLCPAAGEIGKFHVEDGAPVEYLQTIVELAPFFGGHIIGDKKWLV
jgi:hypothetical protein